MRLVGRWDRQLGQSGSRAPPAPRANKSQEPSAKSQEVTALLGPAIIKYKAVVYCLALGLVLQTDRSEKRRMSWPGPDWPREAHLLGAPVGRGARRVGAQVASLRCHNPLEARPEHCRRAMSQRNCMDHRPGNIYTTGWVTCPVGHSVLEESY